MKAITAILLIAVLTSSGPLCAAAAPAASVVPGRNAGPHGSLEPICLVVEASMNNVVEAADQLERKIKDLYAEMNRHEQVESRTGMFEQTGTAFGNFSPDFIMPMGPGLDADVSDGPLLDPRQDVVDKAGAAINETTVKVADVMKSTSMPAGVKNNVIAHWEVLQTLVDSLKRDWQKLNALLLDPDYDQRQVSKLLLLYRADTIGVKEQCKKVAQMLRHEK